MCDAAYVLLVQRLEHRAAVMAAAMAPHVKDGTWALVDEMRAEFDAGLIAEPAPESPAAKLLRELGIT